MDAQSNGNIFDNVEPHRFLPGETRAALWAACERVKYHPAEFSDAVACLDGEYSEAAVLERGLLDSDRTYRGNMREVKRGLDPCDTFPRRKAIRQGRLRATIVNQTIGVAQFRGMRLRGDKLIISNDRHMNDVEVDAGNVELAWRSIDENCRERIRHIKDERRERDARIRQEAKNRIGRFREAVRTAVKGDIPVVNRLECSRRLVLLAAMIAAPEPLSLSAEFADMHWETQGNMLGIGGPYVPGRETFFEKYDFMKGATQWSIAGFMADGFGNLVARALNVLNTSIERATLYLPRSQSIEAYADTFQQIGNAANVAGIVPELPAPPAIPSKTDTAHNTDFTMVIWYGTEYAFALGVQSSAVQILWEEWEKSGLGLHQDTIRNAIDAERDNFRMDTTFRNHPAFGTMIQRCGDGKYKLARPVPVASKPKKNRRKRA